MIIVEGADLTGKTTVAEVLAKPAHLQYKHYSRLSDSFHRFWSYLPDIRAQHVLDRFFMSEPVYCEARGDEQVMDPTWLVPLHRECIDCGCVFILFTADDDLIEERWREGEMYDINLVKHVNQSFKQIAETGSFGDYMFHVDFHYHFTKDNPYLNESQIQTIAWYHQQVCHRASYMKGTRQWPIPAPAQSLIETVLPSISPIG